MKRELIIRAVKRAAKSWRMLVVMLAVSGALSVIPAIPIFNLAGTSTRGSLFASKMLADKLDAVWLFDYVNGRLSSKVESDIRAVELGAVLALLLLLPFHIFWTAGVLAVFGRSSVPDSASEFLRGAAKYFGRFMRLAVAEGVAYAIVLVLVAALYAAIAASDSNAWQESPGILGEWAALALTLGLTLFVGLAFDYAKILTVVRESGRVLPEIARALRFVVKNLPTVIGLSLSIGVMGLAAFALAHWLRASISQSSLARVLMAFVLGQFAVAVLILKRLVLYAAEMDLYTRLQVSPVEAPSARPSEVAPGSSSGSAEAVVAGSPQERACSEPKPAAPDSMTQQESRESGEG